MVCQRPTVSGSGSFSLRMQADLLESALASVRVFPTAPLSSAGRSSSSAALSSAVATPGLPDNAARIVAALGDRVNSKRKRSVGLQQRASTIVRRFVLEGHCQFWMFCILACCHFFFSYVCVLCAPRSRTRSARLVSEYLGRRGVHELNGLCSMIFWRNSKVRCVRVMSTGATVVSNRI
jgi:hypothetical protein